MLEIKVCTEGSCSNKGAYAVWRALGQALEAAGLGDDVEMAPSGCLKDCNCAGVCAAAGLDSPGRVRLQRASGASPAPFSLFAFL